MQKSVLLRIASPDVETSRLQSYVFGESTFLLTSIELPIISRVCAASAEKPYLAFFLKLDMGDGPRRSSFRRSPCSCAAGWNPRHGSWRSNHKTARAMFTDGAASPHSPGWSFLWQAAPARNHHRLLQGPQGERLRSVSTLADQNHRTAKAVTWLRDNFKKALNVDELASMTGMSRSTLNHHFRSLTAMSPLQFQKQLRLHAARQKMLTEELDAASAAFEVGYGAPASSIGSTSGSSANRQCAISKHFGHPDK